MLKRATRPGGSTEEPCDDEGEPGGGRRRLAALALLGVTVSWGSTFVLVKGAVTRIPIPDFLAERFVVAALALLLVRPRSVTRLSARRRWHGVALGAILGFAQILQTYGLAHTAASVSGFITGMYVVFTPLLAAAVFRRRIPRATWLAVATTVVGLAVLSLHGFDLGEGALLALAAAAVYGAHIVAVGAWTDAESAYGLTVLQMGTVAVACLLLAVPGGGVTLPRGGAQWLVMLYTGVVACALAILVQTWAQTLVTPTLAAMVMTLESVFAAVFAVAVGAESVTARMVCGGALVVGAAYVAELGASRRAASG